MKNLCFVLLTFTTFLSLQTNAEIYVSPTMRTEPVPANIVVNAGSYQTIPLGKSGNPNDTYRVTINTNNAVYRDITAYIVDEENLISFKQGYRFRGVGYNKTPTPFVIEGTIPSTENRYLLIDNTYAALINKKVVFAVESKFELSSEQQENTKRLFSTMYNSLKKDLIFPDFDVHIKPCGKANAYSETVKGDIHFCSELIDRLAKNNNEKAFFGIFLHEVGHSLLSLWGIPGNNNEDIADEFSTYVMMSAGPNGYQFLDSYLQFWQNRNSANEALNMLKNGDRHSLSIQRMRNIKENMLTGETFIKRWNRLIYQYNTDEALSNIINKPTPGADVELATKILSQRSGLEK